MTWIFQVEKPLPGTTYLYLKFNLGKAIKLALHIHPRQGELGLNYMSWVVPSYTLFLERGLFYYDLRLKRMAIYHRHTDHEPCENDPNYSMHQCVRDENAQFYTEQARIDRIDGCKGVKGKFDPMKPDT